MKKTPISRRLFFLKFSVTYEREYATFVMMTILVNIVGIFIRRKL